MQVAYYKKSTVHNTMKASMVLQQNNYKTLHWEYKAAAAKNAINYRYNTPLTSNNNGNSPSNSCIVVAPLLTVTVSPEPTFITESASFRNESLNWMRSLRVHMEGAAIGSSSTCSTTAERDNRLLLRLRTTIIMTERVVQGGKRIPAHHVRERGMLTERTGWMKSEGKELGTNSTLILWFDSEVC